MPPSGKPDDARGMEALRRENALLRSRLAEAEQTLEAIRSGGVDAVVVSGPDGEQVFTLQGAERPYRVLVEALHAGAVTVNPEGTILYANRYQAEMLQVPLEQLLGHPFASFVMPEHRLLLGDLVAQSETQPVVGEVALRQANGSAIPVHLALRRIVAPDLHAICIAVTDLTERKRVEEEIREMNASLEARVQERTQALQALFAGSPIALSLTSLKTGQHLEVNDAWIRLFGYSRAEAVGQTVSGLSTWKHPERRERLLADLRAQADGPDAAHEVEFVTKSGAVFPGLLSWHPFELAGEPVVVAAIVDLTEAKRTEQELRGALAHEQEALATNVALLREVHHRVKNNLQMLCDLLYLQMEGMADAEKAGVLRDTYGRIYAIARLHEQLYQSIESGRVRLAEYVRKLLRGFSDLYPTTTLELRAPDDPIYLDVDRAIHAGLIINELLTNAAKHAGTPERVATVEVRLRVVDGALQFEVQDRGPGLPPAFDYEQAKTLGLRIVRILAQRLRAEVGVENDQGARVTIRFALEPEE